VLRKEIEDPTNIPSLGPKYPYEKQQEKTHSTSPPLCHVWCRFIEIGLKDLAILGSLRAHGCEGIIGWFCRVHRANGWITGGETERDDFKVAKRIRLSVCVVVIVEDTHHDSKFKRRSSPRFFFVLAFAG
jgi:hypothetical protein